MSLQTREENALSGFEYYHYHPSIAAAVVFILLFLATTSLHGYQMFRTRTWFMIAFFTGGCFEFIGYCGRAASASETPNWTLGPYIVQSLFLLIAPALFAASIYMELARIVLMVDGDHLLFIRRTWLTRLFVGSDCFSFLMQASGGGLMAGGSSMINIGEKLVLAGLGLQVVCFGLFVLSGVVFHIRAHNNPTPKCKKLPWQKHLFSMSIVSILIFIRSIVRMVEYGQGFDGYIISREWYLYVFDACMMFLAMVTMNIIHPSEVAALIRGSGRMVETVIKTKDVQITQYALATGPWA
ncbi:uncharacterized protein MYCFIDRAFT_72179 [Pseudocercospora fijiensis CIRAD86]|uniref:RTA1 like protein n=1 Tax=Pseudocercospora fijiensis (strain CIRAD86) TaxID=383855 RepID=M3AW75_PSEFD|nr:uncharacterized protein MYCFIDRAFT_72179 [Pseudocercospora fijiensis CIRAD86]EME81378.1 hypothetical protein MYCFIDRAFT_72179 [Pseudocercospora fijiensis CIRAD86]